MHEANVRRTLLLLQQFEFLQTKIQAYEEILSTRWERIKAVIDPETARRRIDNRQTELLAERKRQFEAAQKKPVIKPVLVGAHG